MGEDFFINMGFSVVFTLLKGTIKSEQSKAKYKAIVLKLFNPIRATFAGDPDFQ